MALNRSPRSIHRSAGVLDVQLALDFCKQCGTCLPTCPRGVDIPTLMRTHMYAANSANAEQARATFEEIPTHASLQNCADCSACNSEL